MSFLLLSMLAVPLAALADPPRRDRAASSPAARMVHIPEGCSEVVIREVVEFGNNSTRIKRRSRPMLSTLASMLSGSEAEVLLLSIEGYQSEDEPAESLAYDRALAVQEALLELGAPPSRLVPLGHDAPLWPARDASWSARRVEFDVLLYGACT